MPSEVNYGEKKCLQNSASQGKSLTRVRLH